MSEEILGYPNKFFENLNSIFERELPFLVAPQGKSIWKVGGGGSGVGGGGSSVGKSISPDKAQEGFFNHIKTCYQKYQKLALTVFFCLV